MASRLLEMQTRFHQKQIQEKEEKLMRLYENQQQRAFQKVSRGSAGSNSSISSTSSMGGKVRQMFDERRQKAGVDRSYPLEPLKSKKINGAHSGINNRNMKTIKTVLQKKEKHILNGNALISLKQNAYHNNDMEENYSEQSYITTNNFDAENEIINLMNRHNLNDDILDHEVMPELGGETTDDRLIIGKLANLGGKLPSQKLVDTKPKAKVISVPAEPAVIKKKPNPVVKRTIVRKVISPEKGDHQSKVSVQSEYKSPKTTKSPSASAKTSNARMSRQTPAKSSAASSKSPQTAKTPVARDDLQACKFCNRRFAADRLQVHEDICSRTAKKKRKTYDATKHRVQGTELEPYVGRKGGKTANKSAKQTPSTKSNWRSKHEEFIAAIRAAKGVQQHIAKGGKLSDLPPPPPSSNPDYVQCPSCKRRFNAAAAERHIPKCATYDFNKTKAPNRR